MGAMDTGHAPAVELIPPQYDPVAEIYHTGLQSYSLLKKIDRDLTGRETPPNYVRELLPAAILREHPRIRLKEILISSDALQSGEELVISVGSGRIWHGWVPTGGLPPTTIRLPVIIQEGADITFYDAARATDTLITASCYLIGWAE